MLEAEMAQPWRHRLCVGGDRPGGPARRTVTAGTGGSRPGSVREDDMGYAGDLVDRSTKAWNAHQFGEWSATFSESAHLAGPGGLSGRGRDTQQLFHSIWNDGFPDNQVTNVRIVDDGDSA